MDNSSFFNKQIKNKILEKANIVRQLQDNAAELSARFRSVSDSLKLTFGTEIASNIANNINSYRINLNGLSKNIANLNQLKLDDSALKRAGVLRPLIDGFDKIRPIDTIPLHSLELVRVQDAGAARHKQIVEIFGQNLEKQNEIIVLYNLMLTEFRKSSGDQSLVRDWTLVIKNLTNQIRWLTVALLIFAIISTIHLLFRR